MKNFTKANFPFVCAVAAMVIGLIALTVVRAQALSANESALVSLANVVVTGQAGSNQAYASRMSISGSYALVNWTNGTNSAGVLLASNSSGSWQTVKSGAGEPNASDLQGLGVDSTDANFLVANLRPLPPTNGYSGAASGTSTHNLYTERCRTDWGTYQNYQYADASSQLTFSTPSIQPLNPASAVTADVSVSSGTAIVTLVGPSGTIKSVTLTAGQSGGVGYFSPTAATGVYTVQIQGNGPASMDPGCGGIIKTTVYTDAVWTGTLYW